MTEDEILICPRCNKRTYRDDVHTCAPSALLAEYERRTDNLHFALIGCGCHVTRTDMTPYDCGDLSECAIKLCGKCEVKRDAAIRNLIGVNNA